MPTSCGDKKTDAERRKGLGSAVRKYEEFRQKTVQRFDKMYSALALSHTAGRNQAVAQLLASLSLMRSTGDIRQQPVLTWSKAQVGAVVGSHTENAAHCLPCQLWIDNIKPWDLLKTVLIDRDRLARMLREEVFGHETILPLAFNLADTLSENSCLRGSLVEACAHVITHTKPRQRHGGVLKKDGVGNILIMLGDRPQAATAGIDHLAVRGAYGVWQKAAAVAYGAASEAAAGGISRSGQDYTADILYILAEYEKSLLQLPPRVSDEWLSRFENDLWV